MQQLDFEAFIYFFVTYAGVILPALLVLLVLIFVFNHWRERRLIRQMEDFLTPKHQDILIRQGSLNKPTQRNIDAASQTAKKTPVPSVLDVELDVLKRKMDARLQARKKN